MSSWWEDLSRQVRSLVNAVVDETGVDGMFPLMRPVAPFNQPAFLAPVVTVTGLISMMLLSGVVVTAFGMMLVALLAMYLLLVRVFGLSIEINPLAFGR